MIKEFVEFVREKGVIGLAVGIIVGGAVTKMVNAIVEDFVNPIIGYITGAAGDLATFAYTVPGTDIVFKWGDFLSNLINFLSILLVVYLIFVKSPINRIDVKKD